MQKEEDGKLPLLFLWPNLGYRMDTMYQNCVGKQKIIILIFKTIYLYK